MVYRFTPMFATVPGVHSSPQFGPWARSGDTSATETSLHVTCIRAPPRRLRPRHARRARFDARRGSGIAPAECRP
eukprot:scaffold2584_cov69-Phaeocystis_antarctica.AAC.2